MKTTKEQAQPTPSDTPRKYVGPTPPAIIANLDCGCSKPADQLTRAQQDFVMATVPGAAAWYED